MSTVVEFFIAPDDSAAAAVTASGPSGIYQTVQYGNFSPAVALMMWESAFGITGDGSPRTIGDPASGDEPVVLGASGSLQQALASADEDRLTHAARRWVELQDDDGDPIHPEFARDLLEEAASLARSAAGQGYRLYCWWC